MSVAITQPPMRRLFCWSGGGLPGLDIHAGIWLALSSLGIESTANAGCSAGAIMAALNSAGKSDFYAAQLIRNLRDADVRNERFCWKIRAPWIDWFLDSAPIRKLLEANLPERFGTLVKPLTVAVTRVRDGAQVLFGTRHAALTTHQVADAVLASASISGVFPFVNIHGEEYADGGPRANLPLPEDWQRFDEIYLLIAARPVDYAKRGHGILSRLLLNVDWLAMDQIEDTIARVRAAHKALRGPKVFVIWPKVAADTGALHFHHELIKAAHDLVLNQFAGVTCFTTTKM